VRGLVYWLARILGFSSWPGLTRPSTGIPLLRIKLWDVLDKSRRRGKWTGDRADGRVKPGHDGKKIWLDKRLCVSVRADILEIHTNELSLRITEIVPQFDHEHRDRSCQRMLREDSQGQRRSMYQRLRVFPISFAQAIEKARFTEVVGNKRK
jgi:hypothetical protein